jgi:hypothetical protein
MIIRVIVMAEAVFVSRRVCVEDPTVKLEKAFRQAVGMVEEQLDAAEIGILLVRTDG